MNMSRGKQAVVFVLLAAFFFTVCLPALTATQTTSSVLQEGAQRSQSEIKGLTAPIQSGTEFWLVDIWGPADATSALFQDVNTGRQFLTLCEQPERARPQSGFDQVHYYLSSTDQTLLIPAAEQAGILQDFRILEEVSVIVSPTQTVAPTASAAAADATSPVVNEGTPADTQGLIPDQVPASYFCWGIAIVLVVMLIILLVTLIRRRFGRG